MGHKYALKNKLRYAEGDKFSSMSLSPFTFFFTRSKLNVFFFLQKFNDRIIVQKLHLARYTSLAETIEARMKF